MIHKLLRLARTSADLDASENIRLEDVQAVLSCRNLDQRQQMDQVVELYGTEEHPSLQSIAEETSLNPIKVRKLLIIFSGGYRQY